MPVFQAKARTADTYLAGIGASGALIAGAFVTFMILVGAVTFDAWPRAASLIERGGGQVSIGTSPTSAPATAPSQAPDLVKLLGSGGGTVTHRNPRSEQGSAGGAPSAQGSLGPEVNPEEGGSTVGQEPVQGGPPPGPGPSEPQPRTIVGQTVSSTGNTVQATTDSLGDALGGSDNPGLGGTVSSLGQTLNGTLQGLANGL